MLEGARRKRLESTLGYWEKKNRDKENDDGDGGGEWRKKALGVMTENGQMPDNGV